MISSNINEILIKKEFNQTLNENSSESFFELNYRIKKF